MTTTPDPDTLTAEEPRLPVSRDSFSLFELDQRRANLYAASGYWPDAKSQAQALVKIEAGRALGLPAIVAMSEVHVIQGKPTLGAGALATLVKTSGRYDYRIVEHTEERCAIRFFDLKEGELGESVFTIADARRAGLAGRSTWRQYPRNMLFARALSNGVAWFCPDVCGRVYSRDELDAAVIAETDMVDGDAVEEPDDHSAGALEPAAREDRGKIPPLLRPTQQQVERLRALIGELDQQDPGTDWRAKTRELAGVPGELLTRGGADELIRQLEQFVAFQGVT